MAASFSGQPLLYGEGEDAALRAADVELGADHVAFTACMGQLRTPVRLGIPGGFTVYNALAALGAAVSLGVPLERAGGGAAGSPRREGPRRGGAHAGPALYGAD